jgi:hypothetical protein
MKYDVNIVVNCCLACPMFSEERYCNHPNVGYKVVSKFSDRVADFCPLKETNVVIMLEAK